MEAQSIIKAGAICRVGSGESISILNDPWLPDAHNAFVTTRNAALEGDYMSSLLVIGENRWDEDVIYDMFEEMDVNLILSIPLNQNERDVWYWKKERLGNYSVKSAYVLLQEHKNLSNASTGDRCWKRLWALKIPPKVKHMLWHAATGCLPTKVQLQSKHVNIDAMCPQCQLEPETISHALLTCSFAKDCLDKLRGVIDGEVQESFTDWLSCTFDNWDTKQRQEAAMLCWSLWKCRNELVWNQRGTEVVVTTRVVFNQW